MISKGDTITQLLDHYRSNGHNLMELTDASSFPTSLGDYLSTIQEPKTLIWLYLVIYNANNRLASEYMADVYRTMILTMARLNLIGMGSNNNYIVRLNGGRLLPAILKGDSWSSFDSAYSVDADRVSYEQLREPNIQRYQEPVSLVISFYLDMLNNRFIRYDSGYGVDRAQLPDTFTAVYRKVRMLRFTMDNILRNSRFKLEALSKDNPHLTRLTFMRAYSKFRREMIDDFNNTFIRSFKDQMPDPFIS